MKRTKVGENIFRDNDSGEYEVDMTIKGERVRQTGFPTKGEAEECRDTLKYNYRADKNGYSRKRPKVTLEMYRLASAEDPEFTKDPQLFRCVDHFIVAVGKKTLILDINDASFEKYLKQYKTKGLKNESMNRYMTSVLMWLNGAPGYFPDLGMKKEQIKAPWLKRSASGRERPLEPVEMAKILWGCDHPKVYLEQHTSIVTRKDLGDLFRLMLLTGGREGEIKSLHESQVNWTGGYVTLICRKGGKSVYEERKVPLSDYAIEILRRRLRSDGFFFKFPSNTPFYHTCDRIAEICGLPFGQTLTGWTVYDWRHTAATRIEGELGFPYSATRKLLGHERHDMTAKYTHPRHPIMVQCVKALEDYLKIVDGILTTLPGYDGISRVKPGLLEPQVAPVTHGNHSVYAGYAQRWLD